MSWRKSSSTSEELNLHGAKEISEMAEETSMTKGEKEKQRGQWLC